MRNLTSVETSNLKALTEHSVSLTLIEPTATALKKGIMDATGPVRRYLRNVNAHDYGLQGQGAKENGVQIDSEIILSNESIETTTSLYRPKAKNNGGDPRIWIYGLNSHTNANDIIGLIYQNKKIYSINLTQLPVQELINSKESNPLKEIVFEIDAKENEISDELLALLIRIAKNGPIPSMVDADTSVGRTLETALGIDINSSKQPDYKGIELKSFRSTRSNRKSLFAQVPDWDLSQFKTSKEILEAFGYHRESDFKLYCTVSALKSNSQGLSLRLDHDINQLIESSDDVAISDFAVWRLEKLHERLLQKHKETFWVSAESLDIGGTEHFQYTLVEHTKKPIIAQFDLLIEQGIITLDHLIKRTPTGGAKEKGPIF